MARILITEDEWLIAEDLKNILQSLEHEIVGIASSGEEAIRIVNEMHPDLIFMDIQLDGNIDGLEAAKIIRGKDDTPIIFCTSNTENDSLVKMMKTKPNGLVRKPFSSYDIEIAISNYVNKTEMSRKKTKTELSYLESNSVSLAERFIKYVG